MSSPPTRIGVVVPAKDERTLLPACLHALVFAASQVAVPVTVMVVLDDCTDDSQDVVAAVAAYVAARHPGTDIRALSLSANNVGVARHAGLSAILADTGPRGWWLASTDADSVVPPHWLAAQLRHAAAGAHVVAGTVEVLDWSPHSPAVRTRAITEYARGGNDHRHVHGANLSFTAQAYHAAGGFPPQRFDEDVALVHAFGANAEPITWARDLPVTTSARRQARTPHGFATYLNDLGDHDPQVTSR